MPDLSEDLIVGAAGVAEFLGVRRRQIYHAVELGYLPLFRMGALICARRTTLAAWIEAQERIGLGRSTPGGGEEDTGELS